MSDTNSEMASAPHQNILNEEIVRAKIEGFIRDNKKNRINRGKFSILRW
jgi:hypothetical protein